MLDLELLVNEYSKVAGFKDYEKEEPAILDIPDSSPGLRLMSFLVSPGTDSFLFARDGSVVAGYAHLYAYDFEMIYSLLYSCGFRSIVKKKFCESSTPELREPLHPVGAAALWKNESEWYRPNGVTGFDRDPVTSLIVEAKKYVNVKQHKCPDLAWRAASSLSLSGLGETFAKLLLYRLIIKPSLILHSIYTTIKLRIK